MIEDIRPLLDPRSLQALEVSVFFSIGIRLLELHVLFEVAHVDLVVFDLLLELFP